MAYQFAGRYIEALLKNVNGRPRLLASTLVTIYESDGTTEATVYTDRTKATEAANPVMTDTLGNLAVWLEPGSYYGSPIIDGVAQVAFPMHVDIDPAEADAPTATDVTVTPAGGIAATNVQAALVELDTEKATTGSVTSVSAALTAHEGDAGDAHDASAVSFAPAGTIAATDVQAAIVEVSSDVTTEAAARAAGDALLIPLTQKAAANGVATLGADSKIPTAQLPDLAISAFLGTTASQAAMLALVGQRGDWTVRTDTDPDTTWMLVDDDPSILANWRQLSTVTDAVASVNGRTGSVVGLAEAADLTAETNARTAADALLAPLASPTFTGVATAPALKASGLTGAVAASRYVGATVSGAPVSGTFLVGDFIIDQSAKVWICTVAGTPGTWVSASGTSGALTVISRTVLAAPAASVDLTSIPATYENLILEVMGIGTAAANSVVGRVRFNGDSAANYDSQYGQAQGSSNFQASRAATAIQDSFFLPAANSTPAVGAARIWIPNYARTTLRKIATSICSHVDSGPSVSKHTTLWRSTAAINQVTVVLSSGNFDTGTVVTLYGEAGA